MRYYLRVDVSAVYLSAIRARLDHSYRSLSRRNNYDSNNIRKSENTKATYVLRCTSRNIDRLNLLCALRSTRFYKNLGVI